MTELLHADAVAPLCAAGKPRGGSWTPDYEPGPSLENVSPMLSPQKQTSVSWVVVGGSLLATLLLAAAIVAVISILAPSSTSGKIL